MMNENILKLLTHCVLVSPCNKMDVGQHWLKLCRSGSTLAQVIQVWIKTGSSYADLDQHWLKLCHQATTWINTDLSSVRFRDIHLRSISWFSFKSPRVNELIIIQDMEEACTASADGLALTIAWQSADTVMTRFGFSGLILGWPPDNERCHYKVTTSLIGWAQT